jgi:hypothetical protein
MRILVMIVSHELRKEYLSNINILNEYLMKTNNQIDYCGISNQNDFGNYESAIEFKYKIINPKRQLSKVCDFISQYKNELEYDWYIKIRPDLCLLESINFDMLSTVAINARARKYRGPKHIKHGMSVNGEGVWKNIGDCFYSETEQEVILDDHLYIFHNNIITQGGFDAVEETHLENEWTHSHCWRTRLPAGALNIIGIYTVFTRYMVYSGDLAPVIS